MNSFLRDLAATYSIMLLTRKMMKLRTKEDLELHVDSTVAVKFGFIADSFRLTEVIFTTYFLNSAMFCNSDERRGCAGSNRGRHHAGPGPVGCTLRAAGSGLAESPGYDDCGRLSEASGE